MTSSLLILGCSGGIGKDLRTTSLLLNDNTLIDAGTGVMDLSLEQLKNINQVFVTHSHLDHICSIPLMVDAVGSTRNQPLKVYGIPETIEALKNHIFNDLIWPDFTKIPTIQNPFLEFHTIKIDEGIQITGKDSESVFITPIAVDHSIPAVAYTVKTIDSCLVFSGDTGLSTQFIASLNKISNIKHLIIETSFVDAEIALTKLSGHLCPTLLADQLNQLSKKPEHIWITHLKPGEDISILKEIDSSTHLSQDLKSRIQPLTRGQTLDL